MPLTDTAIRNAKASVAANGRPTDKPYKLGDSGGLYLEAAPQPGVDGGVSNTGSRVRRCA